MAAELGINKATVTFHIRRLELPVDNRFGRRSDWAEIRSAYDIASSSPKRRGDR
jgi:hypothetical protein